MQDLVRTLQESHPVIGQALGLLVLLLACVTVYYATRRLIVSGIRRVVAQTSTAWDDQLVAANVFTRLAHVAPALVASYGVQFIPGLNETLELLIQRVALSVMIAVVVLSIGAGLTAANEIYMSVREYRHRPIKGYLQVVKIILYIIGALLVVATLMDRSPIIFLGGIGAMAAVLLLVFKDTILSLVASVQLTGNDMLRIGDWVEMPTFGADGDVIDVALHTVKVQNWDKTITTIPTNKLIEGSFKNWRGMSDSKSRRIKRAFSIDMATIRFLSEDEVERFSQFALLREYIRAKREEISVFNAQAGRDPEISADLRRLTNVGTFRAYVLNYLKSHAKIHQDRTLIVRQLSPTAQGLPIEIYCFSNDIAWASYEGIQADIFDHILAIAPEFGLRVFQNPSGADLAGLRAEDSERSAPALAFDAREGRQGGTRA